MPVNRSSVDFYLTRDGLVVEGADHPEAVSLLVASGEKISAALVAQHRLADRIKGGANETDAEEDSAKAEAPATPEAPPAEETAKGREAVPEEVPPAAEADAKTPEPAPAPAPAPEEDHHGHGKGHRRHGGR